MNNSNIPEEQTNTCIEQIKQQAIDHLYQFNIELRSLNDINGYINCNITTQQYIPSFKCDNLNLNYCNINHIGTLNATPGIFGSISTTNNTNKSSPSVVLYNTNTVSCFIQYKYNTYTDGRPLSWPANRPARSTNSQV